MAGRVADEVVLSDEERAFLEAQVRRHKAARSLSDRCRMILFCAEGLQSKDVAERLGVHERTVGKWRRRFVQDRIEGLVDEYRPGRPRTVSDTQVAEVIERTLNTTPKDATHWSIRSMAAATGLSHTTIRRIWTAFGLQPHRSEAFKLSTDPLFVDEVPGVDDRKAIRLRSRASNRGIEQVGRLRRLDFPKEPLPKRFHSGRFAA
jgi:transposase